MDVPAGTRRGGRTLFGKPLRWTNGWAVVVTVWVVAAAFLVAARIEVGHVTALSAREAAAIDAVEAAPVEPGGEMKTAEALQALLRHAGGTAGQDGERADAEARPQWYAMDRPWEDRVYVYWELGDYEPLAWIVDDDGTVTPQAETRLLLAGLARLEREGAL